MRNKIKVAVVLHGLGANGIDTLFANLSDVWDYKKFSITYILAVDPDAKQLWDDKVKQNGCKVYHIHDLDKNRLFVWPISLYRALKKYGPFDVIHVNMDMLNGINLLVARMAKIPVRVCHSHVTNSQHDIKGGKNLVSALYRETMKKMIWINSTVRCGCSENAMEYLYGKKWKQDLNTFIINNGIDFRKFQNEYFNVNKKKKELGLDERHKYLITVGRISAAKNVFFIVDIVNEIKRRNLPYKLIWCGTGDLEEEVLKKIKENMLEDYVIMLGVRSDIHEVLKCCDLFLLPSLFEGLGIVLIEAQASGLNCIASDNVPIIADVGMCDFLPVDKGVNIWCDRVEVKLEAPDNNYANSKKLKKFDIETMKSELEKIYSRVI